MYLILNNNFPCVIMLISQYYFFKINLVSRVSHPCHFHALPQVAQTSNFLYCGLNLSLMHIIISQQLHTQGCLHIPYYLSELLKRA